MHPPAAAQQGKVMGEFACSQGELVRLAGVVAGVRVVQVQQLREPSDPGQRNLGALVVGGQAHPPLAASSG
jgi:hypothetical protein